MDYIKRHWRGEMTLAHSFWVNMFLLNILFTAPLLVLKNPPESIRIDNIMFFFIAYIVIYTAIIYPWQIIGTWRSATNHIDTNQGTGWARTAQVLIIIGVLSTVTQSLNNVKTYTDIFEFATRQSGFNDYTITITQDNQRIHYKGLIGPGTTDSVSQIINEHPQVVGIILDSHGGLVQEGMSLGKLIAKHNIDTYTLTGCNSACTLAFISGKKRYVGKSANLGFHGFSALFDLKPPAVTSTAGTSAIHLHSG